MDILVVMVQAFKAISEIMLALLLLRKWQSHKPHYFTDLPFMYGLVFLTLGLGENVDVLLDAEILAALVETQKFRLMFVVIAVSIMCFSLFQIWIPKRKRIKYGAISAFGASWGILTALSPTREAIYLLAAGYLLALIVPYSITYYLVYKHRRLPEIDARFILVAMVFLVVGQGLKTWFLTHGILWISEGIDLAAWLLIFVGLTRPAPYMQVETVKTVPKQRVAPPQSARL
jgi:hypothetical protein